MKILFLCSSTSGKVSTFISEQSQSLAMRGLDISFFLINKKGIYGYLSHVTPLIRKLKKLKPDLIHAHYGLSSLVAGFQNEVPLITTFHGSDVNNWGTRFFSLYALKHSSASIFVTNKMQSMMPSAKKSFVIPCGVDASFFRPIDVPEIISNTLIRKDCLNILFSSKFDNPVKNFRLAEAACRKAEEIIGININLIELHNLSREQVLNLMNIVDCLLLTSFSEGSPQVIKEAMACNCPVISTDVGDASWLLDGVKGCYITSFDSMEIACRIADAARFSKGEKRTNGRSRIMELNLDIGDTAQKIINVYQSVLKHENPGAA